MVWADQGERRVGGLRHITAAAPFGKTIASRSSPCGHRGARFWGTAEARLCFAPGAFLAFHAARTIEPYPRLSPHATWTMYASYPAEIRQWIDRISFSMIPGRPLLMSTVLASGRSMPRIVPVRHHPDPGTDKLERAGTWTGGCARVHRSRLQSTTISRDLVWIVRHR
jgi:hypothetical protein